MSGEWTNHCIHIRAKQIVSYLDQALAESFVWYASMWAQGIGLGRSTIYGAA
ncbi:hypothetical protein CEV31_3489 [Brucella thiophenivorans]|uniref:Uncharacterized protein n=1 Tax=Brucella thiophenivorans TaxID=571255 RepID=A0A256FDY9_9HYPH|nr:hypothetical protein CEV31_3489 [Brucella thiophenivorans]